MPPHITRNSRDELGHFTQYDNGVSIQQDSETGATAVYSNNQNPRAVVETLINNLQSRLNSLERAVQPGSEVLDAHRLEMRELQGLEDTINRYIADPEHRVGNAKDQLAHATGTRFAALQQRILGDSFNGAAQPSQNLRDLAQLRREGLTLNRMPDVNAPSPQITRDYAKLQTALGDCDRAITQHDLSAARRYHDEALRLQASLEQRMMIPQDVIDRSNRLGEALLSGGHRPGPNRDHLSENARSMLAAWPPRQRDHSQRAAHQPAAPTASTPVVPEHVTDASGRVETVINTILAERDGLAPASQLAHLNAAKNLLEAYRPVLGGAADTMLPRINRDIARLSGVQADAALQTRLESEGRRQLAAQGFALPNGAQSVAASPAPVAAAPVVPSASTTPTTPAATPNLAEGMSPMPMRPLNPANRDAVAQLFNPQAYSTEVVLPPQIITVPASVGPHFVTMEVGGEGSPERRGNVLETAAVPTPTRMPPATQNPQASQTPVPPTAPAPTDEEMRAATAAAAAAMREIVSADSVAAQPIQATQPPPPAVNARVPASDAPVQVNASGVQRNTTLNPTSIGTPNFGGTIIANNSTIGESSVSGGAVGVRLQGTRESGDAAATIDVIASQNISGEAAAVTPTTPRDCSRRLATLLTGTSFAQVHQVSVEVRYVNNQAQLVITSLNNQTTSAGSPNRALANQILQRLAADPSLLRLIPRAGQTIPFSVSGLNLRS